MTPVPELGGTRTPARSSVRLRSPSGARWGISAPVARAVLLRPCLWATAAAALLRLARPRWWTRSPFLPVPDGAYWQFRLQTAFGGPDGPPGRRSDAPDGGVPRPGAQLSADDVIAYLGWCRRMPAARG